MVFVSNIIGKRRDKELIDTMRLRVAITESIGTGWWSN